MTKYSENLKRGKCGNCGIRSPIPGKGRCKICNETHKQGTRKWARSKEGRKRLQASRRRYRVSSKGTLQASLSHKNYAEKLRLQALLKVAGQKPLECEKCHCSNLSILQINHINGGGGQEIKNFSNSQAFYRAIRDGIRKTDDLNILCGVCNWALFFEQKSGLHWEITLV